MWPSLNLREYINIVLPGLLLTFLIVFALDIFFEVPVFEILGGTGVSVAIYFVIGLVAGFMIDSCDVILHSRIPLKEITFFRKHMPSLYLIKRCEECNKNNCENRLRKVEDYGEKEYKYKHIDLWFYIFDNIISDYLRSYALSLSSACRGILYLKYFSLFFLVISIVLVGIMKHDIFLKSRLLDISENKEGLALFAAVILIIVYFISRNKVSKPSYYLSRISFTSAIFIFSYLWFKLGSFFSLEFLYLYICFLIFFSVSYTNKATDEKPKGIWARWRNLKHANETWLELNEDLLKDLVCNRKVMKKLSEETR